MRQVLLIDYEPRSIGTIRALLQSAGLQMRLAINGSAGVEAFKADPPDMVLVQGLIPGKHGFEVCREIKGTERGKKTPVILIATPRNCRRHEILATRCDAHVDKPLTVQSLLQQIRWFFPDVGSISRTASDPKRPSAASVTVPIDLEEEEIDRRLDEVIQWGAGSQETGTSPRENKKRPRTKSSRGKRSTKKATDAPSSNGSGTKKRKPKPRSTKPPSTRKRKSGAGQTR